MRALLHFHWNAGARVALRANAFALGVVVFLFGSAPDGLASLRAFLLGVASRRPAAGDRAILAAIAAAFAATAVPRVTLGASGWMRALPIDARASWRAAVAALCMAQLAVVTFVPLCVLAVVVAYHSALSPPKVVALPLMIVAVAAAVLPARRAHTRLLAGTSVVLAIVGTWPAIAAAIVCLAVADAAAPALGAASRGKPRRARFTASARPAIVIWMQTTWRAMRLDGIAATAALPMIVASYAYFITGNNPEMPPSTAATVVRVCGVLAVALYAAALANALLKARQPWPWSRSLPWSSTQRVLADACALGIPLLIIPLGLVAKNASQALVVAALVPFAAAAGAASVRGGPNRLTGAAGECLFDLLLVGGAIAIWPASLFVALAATPFFVRLGARRERDAIATRWAELHHDSAGDPNWLSGA